jgi:hypothetical protein
MPNEIILSIMIIGAVFELIYLFLKNMRFKKEAFENLGKPAELEDAERKIGGPIFVIQSFVPNNPDSKEFSPMITGLGLLSHHQYPQHPTFVKMVFEFGDKVHADGKTKYVITKSSGGVLYLKKK